jgi:hypothetical protein
MSETHRQNAPHAITRNTPVSDLPEFMTPDEIRRFLGISRSSSYEFARQHGIRVGKLHRVHRERVTTGAKAHRDAARQAAPDAVRARRKNRRRQAASRKGGRV